MGLIGRAAELEQLDAALRSAAEGRPTTVLLGGEAGIGKSRLLSTFRAQARRQGAVVLTGTCLELGGEGLPYAAITEALRGLRDEVGPTELRRLADGARPELTTLVPGLSAAGAAARATDLTPASQLQLFEALLGLLTGLAAHAPVLIVLEDVHWADTSTRDLLVFLAHNLREVGVVLVASFRSDELRRQHPLRQLLPRLLREDTVHHLDLGPLDREGFALLLEALIGDLPDPELLEALFERTQGNPFYAEQLVAAGADVDVLPELLRDVLLLSLQGRSEAAMTTVQVIAAAGGEDVGHGLLARAVELPEEALDAALHEAVDAGVLTADPAAGTYTLRHALLTEAVVTTLLPGERVRVHRRLARSIEQDPGAAVRSAPAELAHHWHRAGDQPRSLVASLDAARDAETSLGVDEARAHLERALALWDQVPDAQELTGHARTELLSWAAWLSFLAGQPRRAVALQRAALSELPADTAAGHKARMQEQLGHYLWDIGDGDGAREARAEALRLVPAVPPSAERARALASYSHILMLTNRQSASLEPGEAALRMARALGEREIEAAVLGTLGAGAIARGDEDGLVLVRESRAIAEQLGEEWEVHRSYHNEGAMLLALGRYDEAMTVASTGIEHVGTSFTARTLGIGLVATLGQAALALGRWERAEEVLRSAPRGVGGIFPALNQLHLAYIAACRGEPQRARTALSEARRLGIQRDETLRDRLHTVELLAARAASDPAQVTAGLEAATRGQEWTDQPGRLWEPAIELRATVLRTLADRAAQGGADRARGHAVLAQCHELAEHLPAVLPPARTWLALAEAEHGRLTAAGDAAHRWATATERCDGIQLGYHAAYARLRHAEVLLAQGARGRVPELLRDAYAAADAAGAAPLRTDIAGLARRASIDLGLQRPPATPAEQLGLTPREGEVLELVAAGRTNPEIAERLFISAKTASVHVSNILRKLEVANRGEAAALAHHHGIAPER